jgi:DNA-binding MarR family transcriptional regulator
MRDLLERRIDSFEKFEVVRRLWLRRDEALAVATIADDLQLPAGELTSTLTQLVAQGLVVREQAETYRAAVSSRDAETILAMLELYGRDPLSMLRILNELALRRLRGLTARKFSDAFLLSKKKENGDG